MYIVCGAVLLHLCDEIGEQAARAVDLRKRGFEKERSVPVGAVFFAEIECVVGSELRKGAIVGMKNFLLQILKHSRSVGQPPEESFAAADADGVEFYIAIAGRHCKFFAPCFADIVGACHEEHVVGGELCGFVLEA